MALPIGVAAAALEAAVAFGGFAMGELWVLPGGGAAPELEALHMVAPLANESGGPIDLAFAASLGAKHGLPLRLVDEAASQRHIAWGYEAEGDELLRQLSASIPVATTIAVPVPAADVRRVLVLYSSRKEEQSSAGSEALWAYARPLTSVQELAEGATGGSPLGDVSAAAVAPAPWQRGLQGLVKLCGSVVGAAVGEVLFRDGSAAASGGPIAFYPSAVSARTPGTTIALAPEAAAALVASASASALSSAGADSVRWVPAGELGGSGAGGGAVVVSRLVLAAGFGDAALGAGAPPGAGAAVVAPESGDPIVAAVLLLWEEPLPPVWGSPAGAAFLAKALASTARSATLTTTMGATEGMYAAMEEHARAQQAAMAGYMAAAAAASAAAASGDPAVIAAANANAAHAQQLFMASQGQQALANGGGGGGEGEQAMMAQAQMMFLQQQHAAAAGGAGAGGAGPYGFGGAEGGEGGGYAGAGSESEYALAVAGGGAAAAAAGEGAAAAEGTVKGKHGGARPRAGFKDHTPYSLAATEHGEMTESGLPAVTPAALARVKGRSRAPTPKLSVALRRGKWPTEEEEFTALVVESFRAGTLPLADGTTLRTFLSGQLHSAPMRITKKFAKDSSIGKQVFKRRHDIPKEAWTEVSGAAVQRVMAARERFFTAVHSRTRVDLTLVVPDPFPANGIALNAVGGFDGDGAGDGAFEGVPGAEGDSPAPGASPDGGDGSGSAPPAKKARKRRSSAAPSAAAAAAAVTPASSSSGLPGGDAGGLVGMPGGMDGGAADANAQQAAFQAQQAQLAAALYGGSMPTGFFGGMPGGEEAMMAAAAAAAAAGGSLEGMMGALPEGTDPAQANQIMMMLMMQQQQQMQQMQAEAAAAGYAGMYGGGGEGMYPQGSAEGAYMAQMAAAQQAMMQQQQEAMEAAAAGGAGGAGGGGDAAAAAAAVEGGAL